MNLLTTLRGQLMIMAAATLAGILVLGGLAIQSAQAGAARLVHLNGEALEPLMLIQSVERRVKEVRFRMAGVALGQLPTVGSANHLREVQATLPREWTAFHAQAAGMALPEKERGLLARIDQGMRSMNDLMDQLQAAYASEREGAVNRILENDWPNVHAQVVKPLEAFMPYFQAQAAAALAEATSGARKRTAEVVALGLGILLVVAGLQGFIQVRLARQLRAAKAAVGAVSRFDLTERIQARGGDEISALLGDLGAMQERLRNLVGQVREAADELNSRSVDLARTSEDLAGASRTQAEASTGMAASIHQLSAAIGQMREHASTSQELAQDAGDRSREGRRVIGGAAGELVALAEGARQSSGIVTGLEALSHEVSDIVGVIKEIADQTHLLALNAAIESAHAGAHGRGFSVVSDEVRKLAERASNSTAEIATIIGRIQEGTRKAASAMAGTVAHADRGDGLARQADEAIQGIEVHAGRVMESVEGILLALQEQGAAAQDVAMRVESIAEATEAHSSATRQTSQNAERVAQRARDLNLLVSEFRV